MSKYWEKYWKSIDSTKNQESIGRTKFGKVIKDKDFQSEIDFIAERLELKTNDVLVDLCAGNGLVTNKLLEYVSRVVAIDYSKPLLDNFVNRSLNITKICQNVKEFDFSELRYSKLVWYFSIQHFSYSEVTIILKRMLKGLSSGGKIYIGDIPDYDKIWEFYSKPEYKAFYFEKLLRSEEHIGTWFERDFFVHLLDFLGYNSKFEIINKPENHFNSSSRFDLLITK